MLDRAKIVEGELYDFLGGEYDDYCKSLSRYIKLDVCADGAEWLTKKFEDDEECYCLHIYNKAGEKVGFCAYQILCNGEEFNCIAISAQSAGGFVLADAYNTLDALAAQLGCKYVTAQAHDRRQIKYLCKAQNFKIDHVFLYRKISENE